MRVDYALAPVLKPQ